MISIFILVFFIVARLCFDSFWNSLPVYYSYLFEIIFVLATGYYFLKKKKLNWKFNADRRFLLSVLMWIFVGFLIERLAVAGMILIPFNFNSNKLVVMLLLVAPVLEELIFRMSLWEAVDDLLKDKEIQVFVSTFLFSIGHLLAIFVIPPEFRPFVAYQGVYVLILGVGASLMRISKNSVLAAILVHFGFNFGFYLGTFL
jgi:membrane protease YdiL (CAAX protease family)